MLLLIILELALLKLSLANCPPKISRCPVLPSTKVRWPNLAILNLVYLETDSYSKVWSLLLI